MRCCVLTRVLLIHFVKTRLALNKIKSQRVLQKVKQADYAGFFSLV
jgi:hypothetical protein